MPSTAKGPAWALSPLPVPAAPLAQLGQFSLNSVSPSRSPNSASTRDGVREGNRFLSQSPAAAVQPPQATCELEGETLQTAGSGSLCSWRARLLQLVGPLGCRGLPARGASSRAPRSAPRLRALAVKGTGVGRTDGDVWAARRVLVLRASPEPRPGSPSPPPAQV